MAASLETKSAVLDGKVVYLGDDGRPEFHSLMRRRSPQHFYAFDVLCLNGRDQRELSVSLSERQGSAGCLC
jgi:ATP-dependent DNA ligase